MSLSRLFLLAFLALSGSAAGVVWYFTQSVLYPLVSEQSYAYVTLESVLLVLALLLAVALLFLILGRVIGTPIRKLTNAADAFTNDGTRIPLIIPTVAPAEVKRLTRSFVDLMGHAETAHKRDLEVSRVKSDFISTAAHQLRTPLTSVRWALEALEQGELTEDQRALVKNATDKSHELVGIVGTLLDISAIESGKYKYTFAPTDMPALVAGVVRDFGQVAAARQVSLVYEPSEPMPAVRADGERVKWILNNLVENAIRYTPASGTIRVSIARAPERIQVFVRDTGIGITTEDRGNIFERFFRGNNAMAKENVGNGLGLYIARTIATDHGGDLNFKGNEEGPGTTFTLSLPIAGPVAGA